MLLRPIMAAALVLSSALHAAPAPAEAPGFMSFLPFVILIAFMYFMILRPQMKRSKDHRTMIDSLGVGSEVVFAGGLMGTVKKIDTEYAVITLANNVDVKVQKAAVVSVLPEGTLKQI